MGFNSNLAEILPVFTNFCLKIGVLTGVVLKFAVGGVLFESGAQITSIRYVCILPQTLLNNRRGLIERK